MTDTPKTEAQKRNELRDLIYELTDRMVGALDCPEGKPPEEGKETATFSNLRDALNQVCSVYKLLTGTGDLDETGTALDSYRGAFKNGGTNQGGGRHRNSGARNGARRPVANA